MPLFVLYLKATLENVGRVSLPDNHTFCLTVKNSTGEDVREGVRISADEVQELKDSRGTANFTLKWVKVRFLLRLSVHR